MKQPAKIDVAVLMLFFNRPDHFQKVLQIHYLKPFAFFKSPFLFLFLVNFSLH